MRFSWRWLCIVLGALLCADTLLFSFRGGRSLGVWLPAVFGLPLLLIGIFYARLCIWSAAGFGRFCKIALLCGYCISVLFFGCTSLFLYSQGHKTAPGDADALIVLGCALRGDRLTLNLKRRLDAAVVYLNENPGTACFVSGGQGSGEYLPEAHAMRDYLLRQGIEEGRIIVEDKSQSTYENFAFTYPLIVEHCGENASIVYVTTYFHIYRAGRVAASMGIEASGQGARGTAYITPNDYLRECLAVLLYKVQGKI